MPQSNAPALRQYVASPTSPSMSAADRAAHASASHLSPTGLAALHRLTTALAYDLRDRQAGDGARREIAEVA